MCSQESTQVKIKEVQKDNQRKMIQRDGTLDHFDTVIVDLYFSDLLANVLHRLNVKRSFGMFLDKVVEFRW